MTGHETDGDVVPAATPLEEWLGKLSEAHGAPGGGAACAIMTGIAAGLLGMVAAYTPDEPDAARAAERLARVRGEATRAAEADGASSAAFGAALAMEDGTEREAAVRAATVEATASSLRVGRVAASLLAELRLLREIGNVHVEADLLVAALALDAALGGIAITAAADLALLASHRAPEDGLDDRVAELERELAALQRARDEVARTQGSPVPREAQKS